MTLYGHFTLCFKIHAIWQTTTKISMKIDPHYQQHKRSLVTLVSANIRLMWIFVGVRWQEASNDSEVVDNGSFQRLRWLFLRKL